MSGGWSPVVHLYSHCGGKLNWDDQAVMFRPDLNRRPTDQNGEGFVTPAGSANGELALSAVLADATARAKEAVKAGHKRQHPCTRGK